MVTPTRGGFAGWSAALHAVVGELYKNDLITAAERDAILCGEALCPANREARRRLEFFADSLDDNYLKAIAGAQGPLQVRGMTVVVPHYGETILESSSNLAVDTFRSTIPATEAMNEVRRVRRGSSNAYVMRPHQPCGHGT